MIYQGTNYRSTYHTIGELYSNFSLADDEFRLLIVESVSESGVVCYLNKHKLPFTDVEYGAISYTWGSQPKNHCVRCCGIDINVTKSCFDALSVFAKGSPTLLWIDQLCIDQANMMERGKQVMLMSRIYSGARLVVIWLDKFKDLTCGIAVAESDNDSQVARVNGNIDPAQPHHDGLKQEADDAIRLIGHLSQHYQHQWLAIRNGVDEMNLDGFPTSLLVWDHVLAILGHPYFERRWIVQEVFNREPTQVSVYLYEGRSVPLALIDGCAGALLQYRAGRMPEIGPIVPGTAQERLKHMEHQLRSCMTAYGIKVRMGLTTKPLLIQLLAQCKRTKTTNDCDRIFALWSLAKDDNLPKPDYHIPLDEHLLRLGRHYIVQGQGHVILPLAGLVQRHVETSIPSWCPTWEEVYPVPFGSVEPASKNCCAAGSTTPKMTLWNDHDRTLRVRGALIDIVQQLSPVVAGAGHDLEAIKMLRTFAPDKHLSIAEFEALTAPYSQNLSNFHRTQAVGTIAEQYELLLRLYQFPLELVSREGFLDTLAQALQATDRDTILSHRRFCVTNQGYLGVVHELTRVGDLVTIIEGISVPMILRENEARAGTFQVITDAYFSGLMKGEAMELEFHIGQREFILS